MFNIFTCVSMLHFSLLLYYVQHSVTFLRGYIKPLSVCYYCEHSPIVQVEHLVFEMSLDWILFKFWIFVLTLVLLCIIWMRYILRIWPKTNHQFTDVLHNPCIQSLKLILYSIFNTFAFYCKPSHAVKSKIFHLWHHVGVSKFQTLIHFWFLVFWWVIISLLKNKNP